MIKEWFVILNPIANDGIGHFVWSKIEVELQANKFDFELVQTQKKRHAVSLTMDAIERGYRKILTVGGDGTLSESVNGIFKQKICPPSMITSAHIPAGANNNWARYHKVTRNFKAWIPQIKATAPSLHDVGLVHYKLGGWEHHWYFISVAACAYPGEVALILNERLSGLASKSKMFFIILSNLLTFKKQELVISHDKGDKKYTGKFHSCDVGICTHSGGLPMTQHAIHDDGYLAIAHDKGNLNGLSTLHIFYKLLSTQKLFKDRRVIVSKVKHLDIEVPHSSTICHLEADDEYLGQAPCRFEIRERAWNVILPPKTEKR